jgi:hypothetical protein
LALKIRVNLRENVRVFKNEKKRFKKFFGFQNLKILKFQNIKKFLKRDFFFSKTLKFTLILRAKIEFIDTSFLKI